MTPWMSGVQSHAGVACVCFMPDERIHVVGYDHNHMEQPQKRAKANGPMCE